MCYFDNKVSSQHGGHMVHDKILHQIFQKNENIKISGEFTFAV